MQPPKNNKPSRKEDQYRINEEITAPMVRIVGENVQQGIYPIEEAIQIAEELGKDLVEIAPNAEPPVCRIIEYSKYLFEQKKREKEIKKKQHVVQVKEIRFGPNTDDHDFDFKVKHSIAFLQEGHKIKAYVVFHGRSIVYKERGEDLLKRFVETLEQYAKVETPPKLEGKRLFTILAPKK
ncbi:MAG: translation initiation factor IF-3 [Bacteroidia bacterium]|nr:translation initiation factor IF-3 [Bacteroidia bacterium]